VDTAYKETFHCNERGQATRHQAHFSKEFCDSHDYASMGIRSWEWRRSRRSAAFRSLFAQDAVALMHEHATGALRDVDRVAHGAVRDAARRRRKTVDRDAVERVLAGRLPIA
jgi:hypothetical protein